MPLIKKRIYQIRKIADDIYADIIERFRDMWLKQLAASTI